MSGRNSYSNELFHAILRLNSYKRFAVGDRHERMALSDGMISKTQKVCMKYDEPSKAMPVSQFVTNRNTSFDILKNC